MTDNANVQFLIFKSWPLTIRDLEANSRVGQSDYRLLTWMEVEHTEDTTALVKLVENTNVESFILENNQN